VSSGSGSTIVPGEHGLVAFVDRRCDLPVAERRVVLVWTSTTSLPVPPLVRTSNDWPSMVNVVSEKLPLVVVPEALLMSRN
jgi:hypothetical protein